MECGIRLVSPGFGEFFPLKEGETTVGRSADCDIQLMFDTVSRVHARFHNWPSFCEIEDAGSSNGVFVNGVQVKRYRLASGDEIRLGECVLRFEENTAGAADFSSPERIYSHQTHQVTVRITRYNVDTSTSTSQIKNLGELKLKPKKPQGN